MCGAEAGNRNRGLFRTKEALLPLSYDGRMSRAGVLIVVHGVTTVGAKGGRSVPTCHHTALLEDEG